MTSLIWPSGRSENLRFADLGGLPSPEERAAHVAAIDKIKTGR
jgi:hypothetical protein